jgi:hypothetical protein
LAFAGTASARGLHGARGELTALTAPERGNRFSGAWVGIGTMDAVYRGTGPLIRAGLRAGPDGVLSIVYEVRRYGYRPRTIEVYRYVRPGERYPVAILESPRHPGWWVVYVGRRAVSRGIYLPARRPGWRAFGAIQSAAETGMPCARFAYSVDHVGGVRRYVGRRLARHWIRLPQPFLTAGTVGVAPHFAGFVARDMNPEPPPPPPKLAWAPPRLTAPATLRVGPGGGEFRLQPGRDYVLRISEVSALGGVRLIGGHNVVIVGGHITIPWAGDNPTIADRVALYLYRQTGTVHVEGLLIDNAGGDLSEGIQINAPAAVVQLENVRVSDVHARDEVGFTDNHPDLVQPWGGVAQLRVHRFSGSSDAQGFFLVGNNGPIGRADLRDVNMIGSPTARHLFWHGGRFPVTLTNVWIQPAAGRPLGRAVWPDTSGEWPRQAFVAPDGSVSWPPESGIAGSIFPGVPPEGDFVPAPAVGAGYVSPGYEYS